MASAPLAHRSLRLLVLQVEMVRNLERDGLRRLVERPRGLLLARSLSDALLRRRYRSRRCSRRGGYARVVGVQRCSLLRLLLLLLLPSAPALGARAGAAT